VLLLCGVYVNLTVQSERKRGNPHKPLTDLTSPRNFWMHATSSQHSSNKAVFKIKFFYSVKKQQKHTIISTLAWLDVLVFSRPPSGQYFLDHLQANILVFSRPPSGQYFGLF